MHLSKAAITLLLGASGLVADVSSSEHPNKSLLRKKEDGRQLKPPKHSKASKRSKASSEPSSIPSDAPSDKPSKEPSGIPSYKPSDVPSAQPSREPSDQPTDSSSSAVFTMSNGKDGNQIIMFTRDEESGVLALVPDSPFDTGGEGGDEALESFPFIPLASQGPLIVSGNCLLAVNAGSNTVSTFKILSRRIERVSIVGSGGEIPVSIAANENHGFVYVLNAGLDGSISGFNLDKETCKMKSIDDSTVSLKQSPLEQVETRLNPFYYTSPTQVDFTPNGEQLIVTIKGIRGIPDGGGTINRFNVDSTTGVISSSNVYEIGDDSIVPMGFDFDDKGNLLLVDLFGGRDNERSTLAVYNVTSPFDTPITSSASRVDLDQYGAGWVQFNSGCAFTANLLGSISSVEVFAGEAKLINSTEVSGIIYPMEPRFSSDGNFMYVLSNDYDGVYIPAIRVYDTKSSGRTCGLTEVQVISDGIPDSTVTGFGATGLAVW